MESEEMKHLLSSLETLFVVPRRTLDVPNVSPLVDVEGRVAVEERRDVFAP